MKKKHIIIILLLIITLMSLLYIYNKRRIKENTDIESIDLNLVKENYSHYIKINSNANLYNENFEVIGKLNNVELTLDDEYEIINEYYKLESENYYVKFNDVEKLDKLSEHIDEYKTYKNYIKYNKDIITNDKYNLENSSNSVIILNETNSYRVIINDIDNKYGIEFNNQLFYISKSNISEIVDKHYEDLSISDGVAVLNYHYTISVEAGENKECTQIICMTDTQVDEEIKYLKENNFYATTMKDLELFVDKKIQLPSKSVTITIDDGWYVVSMINILEKYQMNGTLFLIGSLISPDAYRSEYLEIHSHTWNMHNIGDCQGGHGGAILCFDREKVLEDLKKSRESLNDTPYFCFPFYEYNNRAVELLKEAGFRMSFIGDNKKVHPGDNKYLLNRFVLYNYTTLDYFKNIVN